MYYLNSKEKRKLVQKHRFFVTPTGIRKYVWNLRNATSTCIPLRSICWAKLLSQNSLYVTQHCSEMKWSHTTHYQYCTVSQWQFTCRPIEKLNDLPREVRSDKTRLGVVFSVVSKLDRLMLFWKEFIGVVFRVN